MMIVIGSTPMCHLRGRAGLGTLMARGGGSHLFFEDGKKASLVLVFMSKILRAVLLSMNALNPGKRDNSLASKLYIFSKN